jgi:hypothetical protein
MFLKQLYIHVLINVPRLLIEKDVVDINNEILTSITKCNVKSLKEALATHLTK